MRIWRAQIDPERAVEYEQFARDLSLAMFRRHDGFVRAVMARDGPECTVVTLWHSAASAEALLTSADYLRTVAAIASSGFMRGDGSLEVGTVHLDEGVG